MIPPGGEKERILLSLLSALLLLLAQPPFHLVLLPFVALVPLAVALGRPAPRRRFTRGRTGPVGESGPWAGEGDGAGGALSAAWAGLAFGAFYWGALLSWVPLVVAPRFSWAFPGYLAQVGLLAGLTALMAWSTHRLQRTAGIPLFLALPLAWVGMEWLKAHFPLGLSFPWLGLGITLTARPELLGVAEWTGEGGVAFWLALVNGLLGSAVLGWREGGALPGAGGPLGGTFPGGGFRGIRPSWWLIFLALPVAVLPALLGVIRAATLPMAPGPRVVVVGTDVPPSLRLDPVEGSRRALDEVEETLHGLAPGLADLVILPEAVVGLPLEGPSGEGFRKRLAALARAVHAPVLVGALGGGGESSAPPTNSAFLLDAQGIVRARYDKVRLVPGMEWKGYRAGVPGPLVHIGDMALGPLICYESIFGSLASRYGRLGGTLLVNLTSDAWFGQAGEWPGKGFLAQHPAHLVMRAVETRMGVARAANGGYSFLLDPLGRPLTQPVPPGRGMSLASVPVFRGMTLFSRTGDLVGPFSALSTLLLLLLPAFRRGGYRRRSENSGNPTG